MDTQTKIVGIRFVPNDEVRIHENEEIKHLVKRGIIAPEV